MRIDPYEGRISDFTLRNWMKVYSNEYPNLPKEQLERSRATIFGELENKRHKVILNCRHINESESAAIWNSYTKRDYGIAIKTTFRRLSDSLDKAIPTPFPLVWSSMLIMTRNGWNKVIQSTSHFCISRKVLNMRRS